MTELDKAQERLEELRERKAKIERARAQLSVPDLEAFAEADDATRRKLYDVDRERCLELYAELADQRVEKLIEGKA